MGVVHRDLKPENIMVRDADGVVKVLDFGIAKDLHASIAMTRPGMYMGTAGYSAPEQIRGDAVDARTDIFSLGAILYELLTGKVAFEAKRTSEILRRTVKGEPVPVVRHNQDVSTTGERAHRDHDAEEPGEASRDLRRGHRPDRADPQAAAGKSGRSHAGPRRLIARARHRPAVR